MLRGWRTVTLGFCLSALVLAPASGPQGRSASAVDVNPAGVSGRVIIDGSSTVWPVAAEAAERFTAAGGEVRFDIEVSGTSGGFRRFCEGASDVATASREMNEAERDECTAAGVVPLEIAVALDGVTVVVNRSNGFAACLTVGQLRDLWTPESPVSRWRDLDPAWPDEPIELFGPGPDSGTFDFFTEAILGEAGLSRIDYTPSESDFLLIEGMAEQPAALGYFGFGYAESASDRLSEVAIDSGDGCVAPSRRTIADGSYVPLTRQLYMYVDGVAASPETMTFVRFLLGHGPSIVEAAGFVPLPADHYEASLGSLATPPAGALATPAPDEPGV